MKFQYLFFLFFPFLLAACSSDPEKSVRIELNEGSDAVENQTEITPTLVIHGGAGTILKENMTPELEAAYTAKLTAALNAGYSILHSGGTSNEAVIAAIQIMEESPLFNAGVGAVFTYEGTNELDASFMDGQTGKAGAVAGVKRIKSPIMAAYTVMKKSPHVMMAGEGAESFSRDQGLEMVEPEYFYSPERREQLKKMQDEKIKEKNKDKSYIPYESDYKYGTVGAVALDKNGNISAGTSTGGMTNKRYGRIGDSPIIGAGTYANNSTCGVSATGHGEYFIRNVVAYDIAARMKYKGESLETASHTIVENLKKIGGAGGVICLDHQGNISTPFNTPGMYRGWITKKGGAVVKMYAE
ncbi:MAG: isoaspartyl peptidase/L-asparaginase [Brumimicrobium sp.]|nr:isoaspartyl peptidase/L-asparaginase [Brumimicrobium sp.]